MHKPAWMTEQQYIAALESFLAAVAIELKCLPSFADPTPEDGNAHIMRKLRDMRDMRDLTANKESEPTSLLRRGSTSELGFEKKQMKLVFETSKG